MVTLADMMICGGLLIIAIVYKYIYLLNVDSVQSATTAEVAGDMGNCGLSSFETTRPLMDNGDATALAAASPDIPDKRVYIALLAEETGEQNGTLQVKQLRVFNYHRLLTTMPRKFRLSHVKRNGKRVPLRIQSGDFRPISARDHSGEIITFTGPDNNFTMSHTDTNGTLYLRGRREGRAVIASDRLRDDSYFSIRMRPQEFTESGVIFDIFVVHRPTLAFKYNETNNVVETQQFNVNDAGFRLSSHQQIHPT